MDADEHAADIARFMRAFDERLPNDGGICWCGREKQPDEDHAMCWPGM